MIENQTEGIVLGKCVAWGAGLFLIGAVAMVFLDPFMPASISNSKSGYQDGFATAKALVENSSVSDAFRAPSDIRSISGTVTAVNGTQLTVHYASMDPFADPALSDRTVLIDASTEVTKLIQKDPKTFQSELAAFAKTSREGEPPAPFAITQATAASIKAGDRVTVTAEVNISTLKEFTASQIQVQENTATPAT